MPAGRPSIYSDEIAMEICTRLAEGESLRTICDDEHMPSRRTVLYWLLDKDHAEFLRQYTLAREAQADHYAEEIIQIADTPQLGVKTKTNEDGEVETTEGDMIEHRRLQVDARKWYASKLAPKKYADKLETTLSGPDGGAVQHSVIVKFV